MYLTGVHLNKAIKIQIFIKCLTNILSHKIMTIVAGRDIFKRKDLAVKIGRIDDFFAFHIKGREMYFQQ
ncbi:hypothetical protein C3400_07495 [Klebsiella oxytoca]|nr:hypothetical protein C2U46_04715 [Klebsiella oxytoca]POT70527.1 hypothetical protein C3412_07930 [Klebsiella oxytoca]POT92089.1 hypothetical protein C3416_03040 [Klebsiella oxytoca]POU95474.1 hypothetical protein C3400_07495 [Klebsiella oxytoca]